MKTPQSHELQQVHIKISDNNMAAQHSPPVSKLLYPLMTVGFRNYRYGSLNDTSRAILKHWGFIACLLLAMVTVKAIGQCTPPTVNNISDQVLCNGTTTTAIPFTGALAGTTYKWTNNTPSVGLAASGTGDIAAFMATNTTNAPITAMVTVTPSVSSPELAYITNDNDGTVSVINTATNTVVATVTVGGRPNGVSVSPDGSRVYVANQIDNSVSVINTATNTVVATVSVGTNPFGISVSPDGSRVYVANKASNSVSVINTATNTVVATVTGVNIPLGVSVSPDGSRVYVTDNNANTVSVIKTSDNTVEATVIVADFSSGLSVSPDGSRVYVVSSYDNTVRVIKTSDNSVTSIAVGNAPFGVSVSPDGSRVYVANSASNSISVINTATNMVIATVTVGNRPIAFGNFIKAASTCTGTSKTFKITVNPTATVNAVSNQVVCNTVPTTAINFSSPTTGGTIVYNWVNNTPSVGLAASGSGNIGAFTATNATTAPVTATITVTPSYTNGGITCTGTPLMFTITVNPTATVNVVSNQVVCNGTPTTAINFSSPTTGGTIVYNWVNNTPSVGLAASGSGNIGAFTATNATTAPVTATITVTPSYTNGGVTCTGTALMFTFTVNPTPTVSGPANLIDNNTIGQCGKNIPYNTSSTGVPAPTITYAFTGATTNSGSGNGGGSFFNVGKTTVTLTATNSCGTGTYSFDITINDTEKPKFTACPANITVDNTVGRCDAVVNFTVTASDNCTNPQSVVQTAGLASGSVFPVGETTNSFKATDAAGNASTCTFTVTVKDNEKPVVQCKNRSFDFTYGGSVTLIPQDILQSVSDNCGTIKSLNIDRILPFNGSTVGTFFVTLTATDNANNAASCTANITVTRSELPHVICPDNQVINQLDLGTTGSIPATTATTNAPFTSLTSTDKTFNMACTTGNVTPPAGFPLDVVFNTNLATNADRVVVRTFAATFVGFSSTCSQVFYIKKPDCTKTSKPQNATAICINGVPYIKPEDISIGNTLFKGTGFPHFENGTDITAISLGLLSSFTDAPLSNGVIVRTWTVRDNCGVACATFTQNITIPTCVTPQIAISGDIKRETGDVVMATVKIYNTRDSINKTEASFYNFPSLPIGESYRVRPERNTDILNGVSTFDINVIAKYLLGLESAKSPYQLIAMDVNRNGEVEAGDMLVIRNLVLRKIDNFPNNTAWRFIPKSYVFKNPANPFAEDFPEILSFNNPSQNIANADFVAVKVGDGNLSARTNNLTAVQVRTVPETDYLELPAMVMEAGKAYRIPVKTHIKSLIALQFALILDKNVVENFSIENGDLAQFGEGNYNVLDKNTVITAWASTKGTSDNTIFTLVVKAKKQVSVKDLVSLNTSFSDNLGYNTEGGEKHLQLNFTGGTLEKAAFELHQNRPNPFSNETTISFILPETNTAELSIFDITGRKVYTLNRAFSKGYNEVILNKAVLQNTGVYFYRLQSDKYSEVKRLFYLN